jgi:hypothetical protein
MGLARICAGGAGELAFLPQSIENDGGRLRNSDWRAARTAFVDNGRNGPSRIDCEELRFALIPFVQIEPVNTVLKSTFSQCERGAATVHRGGSEEINHFEAGSWERRRNANSPAIDEPNRNEQTIHTMGET